MKNLNKYFDLFDQSRTSEEAFKELVSLFSDDIIFVLSGNEKKGIDNWKLFVKMVYKENLDLKHMFEGWNAVKGTNIFETSWAVCGKNKSGEVYTQTGKDIAKLDENGKIIYLENVPDNSNLFNDYK